jgi:hypothetical protein
MRKNLSYKDLNAEQSFHMENTLYNEIHKLGDSHPIFLLLEEAIWDYKKGLWRYDGPTFSKIYKDFWEVPAFIHDWRNSMGYVSYYVDGEMFSIMISLNYPIRYIIQRYLLTRFTFINIFIKYISRKLKIKKPINLFTL